MAASKHTRALAKHASAGLIFALVAAGAWDLGAARATGFAAVVTAIAWVFVL